MNNTIINSKENIYSIENLSKICHEKSLDLLIQSIEKLDDEIKDSKDRKTLFDIKGFYKRTINNLIISFKVTAIINPNNKTIPTVDIIDLTFGLISFLVIPSIINTKKCHPSNPGNGNKLKIAKLQLINPQKYKK